MCYHKFSLSLRCGQGMPEFQHMVTEMGKLAGAFNFASSRLETAEVNYYSYRLLLGESSREQPVGSRESNSKPSVCLDERRLRDCS